MRSWLAPHEAVAPPRLAVLGKGFRPFFLVAAIHGAVTLPLFLLVLAGRADTGSYLASVHWHAHEMVFGFTAAVFAGFLLTAIGNWTGRRTVEGAPLALLVLLWVLGRAAMLAADHLPRFVPAILDVAFLPALAVACAGPVVGARSSRNYGFVVMLGALSVANAATHAAALGLAPPELLRLGNLTALDLVTVALVVMTGRVVPMFTRNALRADEIRTLPALERAAAVAVVVALVLDTAEAPGPLAALVRGAAGVLAIARMRHWGSSRTARAPLLWILHAGSLWIGVGLLLRAAGTVHPLVTSAGIHAVTAGAIGSLTLGMMTRVGLGHTGRMLAVPPLIAAAFGAMVLAGAVRVLSPLVWPGALEPLVGAGLLWSAAFAAYLGTYTGLLTAPRVDGRPG